MISNMTDSGFLKPHHAEMIIHTDNEAQLLSAIQSYQAPKLKWS
jgi:hypothetical protein